MDTIVNVRIPDDIMERLDNMIKSKRCENRSDAIRYQLRKSFEMLKEGA